MIAAGVASPMAHGQAMIRTVTATSSDSSNECPVTIQPTSVTIAITITTGTNTSDTRSARRSIGAFRTCASSTSFAICARAVSEPTRVVSTNRAPDVFSVAANTSIAGGLVHRHRLAGQHRFVDRGSALADRAVDGDLLAGPHPDDIADLDIFDGNLDLYAVAQDGRFLRPHLQQRFDRFDARLFDRCSKYFPSRRNVMITHAVSK